MAQKVKVVAFLFDKKGNFSKAEKHCMLDCQQVMHLPVPPRFYDVAIATIHTNSTNHRAFGANLNFDQSLEFPTCQILYQYVTLRDTEQAGVKMG